MTPVNGGNRAVITAAGVLTVGVAVLSPATAAADPAPPPAPPDDPAPPMAVPIPGLDETTVLGQNAAPAAPGAGPGVVPNLHAFNNAYGPQQNLVPSAPGQGEQFDVAPGEENADVNARTWMGRYIDMYRAGMLRGGLLGQVPQEQLGEPLPGTAPPPGTNIPPGPSPAVEDGAPPG